MKKPAWYFYLLQICMLIINLAGLMSLSQEKIKWSGVFADVIDTYVEYISNPVRNYLSYLEEKFAINLDWIPIWFPDYIPIASAFFFAFVISCTSKNNTNIFIVLTDFFKDVIKSFRQDGVVTLGGLLILFIFIALIFLLSPFILIILPLLYLSLIAFGIIMMLNGMILLLHILAYATFIALVLLVFYFVFKYKHSNKNVCNMRNVVVNFFIKSFRKLRISLRRLKKNVKNKHSNFREGLNDVVESFGLVAELVIFQYKVVMLLALIFLIAFAINQSAL